MASTERALAEDRAGLLCRSLSQILGSDHPAVVSTLHDLAVLCDAENRKEEARALWQEARRLVEPSKGVPDAAVNMHREAPIG